MCPPYDGIEIRQQVILVRWFSQINISPTAKRGVFSSVPLLPEITNIVTRMWFLRTSCASRLPSPTGTFRPSKIASIRLCFYSDKAISIVFAVVLRCPDSSNAMPRTFCNNWIIFNYEYIHFENFSYWKVKKSFSLSVARTKPNHCYKSKNPRNMRSISASKRVSGYKEW